MPSGFSTCRLHPSDSTLVTAICAVKDSNAIDCNQHQVVTLPPSHSHHVIRMDPATQLKNVAAFEVTFRNQKEGWPSWLRFRLARRSHAKTHAFNALRSAGPRSPSKQPNITAQAHASSSQHRSHVLRPSTWPPTPPKQRTSALAAPNSHASHASWLLDWGRNRVNA